MSLGEFQGFKVNNHLEFQLLPFADETTLVGEGSLKNLWCIKALLRGFEQISRLSTNLYKRKLIGLNLEDSFMHSASSFLACGRDIVPLNFMGIPVGSNYGVKSTWKSVVNNQKRRLSTWKCRLLSIGGRITVINSVLISIPISSYLFSKLQKWF